MKRSWLPPLLWAGVIVFATSVPSSMVPRQLGPLDKAVHFSIYAVLSALVVMAGSQSRLAWKGLILVIAAVAAFGAVDEWHQRFIPGRSTEFADWVADSLGGIAGVVAAFILKPIWKKRSQA